MHRTVGSHFSFHLSAVACTAKTAGKWSAEFPVVSSCCRALGGCRLFVLASLAIKSKPRLGKAWDAPSQNSEWPISIHIMAHQCVQSYHSASSDIQTPGGQCEPHWALLSWFHRVALHRAGFAHHAHAFLSVSLFTTVRNRIYSFYDMTVQSKSDHPDLIFGHFFFYITDVIQSFSFRMD